MSDVRTKDQQRNSTVQMWPCGCQSALYDDGTESTHFCKTHLEELREPESVTSETCVCGEPSTPGITHRTDGPCYVTEPPASDQDLVRGFVGQISDEIDRRTSNQRCARCEESDRWLANIYNTRGHIGDEMWAEFRSFYEQRTADVANESHNDAG